MLKSGRSEATLLDVKSRVPLVGLCLLLAVGGPMHVVTHYGNQELDYFPREIVSGLHFFDDKTVGGYVTGAFPVGKTRNVDRYQRIGWEGLEWIDNRLLTDQQTELPTPHYIAIDRRHRAKHEFFYGDTDFIKHTEAALRRASSYAFIYDNACFQLYINDNRR